MCCIELGQRVRLFRSDRSLLATGCGRRWNWRGRGGKPREDILRLNIHTVYIHFVDGVEAFRPVKALVDLQGCSQILPTADYDPTDRTELWSFRPGDKVLVRNQEFGKDKTIGDLAYAPYREAEQIKDLNWFLYNLVLEKIQLGKPIQESHADFINQIRNDLAQGIFHYPVIKEKIQDLG